MLNKIRFFLLTAPWFILSKQISLKQYIYLNFSQWFSKKTIIKHQEQEFKKLLNHSFHNSTYYNKILHDFNILPPYKGINLKEIERLPMLTKLDIQTNLNDLIAKNYSLKKLYKNASGGSTGAPTIIYQDPYWRALRSADALIRDSWCGWKLGDRVARIWGAPGDKNLRSGIGLFLQNSALGRELFCDAFSMNKELCVKYLYQLKKFDPHLIVAYSGALKYFADVITNLRIDLVEFLPSLKSIIFSAEKLAINDRENIEKIFGVKLYNRYGSREVGLIASECNQRSGLHVNDEQLILNYVKIRGSDDSIICVTDLHNYAMPLIKYNLEDTTTGNIEMKCPCGRNHQLIGNINGRVSDFLVSNEGVYIHGEYFTHLVYGLEEVKKFQFLQDELNNLTIYIQSKNRLALDKENYIMVNCLNKLGDINIKFEYVDDIKPSKSGKNLFVISHVRN